MKDYYRILGLEPDAQVEEIHAAYRRLIKAYHPDKLGPSQREDPVVQRKVRELNEAYEILSHRDKRLQYDRVFRWRMSLGQSKDSFGTDLEMIRYLVRCGKTGSTYAMHLVRTKGSDGPFTVLGFEPMPQFPMISHTITQRIGVWRRIASALNRDRREEKAATSFPPDSSDSQPEDDIQELLDGSVGLSMGDIDWGFHTCPDCGSICQNENGTFATWSGCSTCGHIKCVGSFERTRKGIYSVCPWCGKRNRVTRSVLLGKTDHLTLKGISDLQFRARAADDMAGIESEHSPKLDEP